MAWIESHQGLGRHPKTKKLARMLGASIPETVGYLHLLWWWALEYAKDGDITKFDCWYIAEECEWKGDCQDYITALIDSGFVDLNEERLSIHDWQNGRHSRKERSEVRKAWDSMAHRIRPIILERDEFTCQECGQTEGSLEIDHIIPIAQGGTNELSNLQVLCMPCNRRKGAN